MNNAANVIPFPQVGQRYQEPLRQAITPAGIPVRVGDRVFITGENGWLAAGTVTEVLASGADGLCALYEIRCDDAVTRVATAQEIEALP
jgi:hypothetical protein